MTASESPRNIRSGSFERFYRIEKSRSKGKGGSGLGLAIVKHIAEAHDTMVKVESTPGEGSVFRFTLPLGNPVPAAIPIELNA